MWSTIIAIFLVIFGPVNYYIGIRGWQAIGRHVPFLPKWLYWAAFSLLACTFPVAEFGEDVVSPGLLPILTYAGGFWIVAMVYFFLIILLIDIIRLADKTVKVIPNEAKESIRLQGGLGLSVLILVLSITSYGIWNARHPVISRYDLAIHKKANGLKKMNIIMVSDLHIGSIVHPHRLEPLVAAVNRLKPDLIVFVGDIVEQSLDPAEQKELVDVLSGMQARYGKFAVNGNHDRYGSQNDGSADYLTLSGITMLHDTYEKTGNSIYLIGRNNGGMHRHAAEEAAAETGDASGETDDALAENQDNRPAINHRKELPAILQGVDDSLPLVLLDHQPVDVEIARKNKVDLQLGGHTHDGQVFPINLVTGMIYKDDWGLLTEGAYHLIVSCGYGTWGPPLRIGNHPEIVDINLQFD